MGAFCSSEICMYPSTELKVLDNEVLLLNVLKLARHKTSYRDKQIKLEFLYGV